MLIEDNASTRVKLIPYGAAVLATVVAILLRLALTPLIGQNTVPFITFFPAVLFSAWYGGFRPAPLGIVYPHSPLTTSFLHPDTHFPFPTPLAQTRYRFFSLLDLVWPSSPNPNLRPW